MISLTLRSIICLFREVFLISSGVVCSALVLCRTGPARPLHLPSLKVVAFLNQIFEQLSIEFGLFGSRGSRRNNFRFYCKTLARHTVAKCDPTLLWLIYGAVIVVRYSHTV